MSEISRMTADAIEGRYLFIFIMGIMVGAALTGISANWFFDWYDRELEKQVKRLKQLVRAKYGPETIKPKRDE